MSFRSFALAALVLLSAFSVVGCGIRDDDGAVSENVLTAELVVPPASQELAAPTATAAVEKVRVNVPNRGYNSYGDPDAPITMFDFSDFL